MKTLATALLFASAALVAGGVAAQSTMQKDAMAKPMTMQECKDHMTASKAMAKKDDATMKKDTMCADMMKKEGSMMKDDKAAPKK